MAKTPVPTSRQTKRKARRRIFVVALLFCALLVSGDYLLYPLLPIGGRSFNHAENGSWLRDTWYLGTERESVASLASRLQSQGVRYACFHTRFIQRDGKLHFRNPAYIQRVVRQLHLAPGIKALAWVYIGNQRGLTGVDIADPTVRHTIAQEMRWLTQTCGFDGVQLDYEISADNDTALLQLLTATRATLPSGKLLGVATPMWLPSALCAWGWSEAFFAQVAAHCDQMAVMAYDSGVYLPRGYVWLVAQQAIRVTRAAQRGNPRCRVLIGVPTYEDGGPSHHLRAENLRMALKGVREGLVQASDTRTFAGIAPFADYSTDAAEAKTLHALWPKRF